MGKITFILGGSRSGKSAFALQMAGQKNQKAAFIATAQALDKEMRQRISLHKKNRPQNWETFEEPHNLVSAIKKISPKFRLIIIDCLTLWVSNLMLKGNAGEKIEEEIIRGLDSIKKMKNTRAIIVSNEVGMGLVPDNRLGRAFRDIAGKVNQAVAASADEVFFMAAGIPIKINPVRKRKTKVGSFLTG